MAEPVPHLVATLDEILKKAVQLEASDVHISVGRPIRMRLNGTMQTLSGSPRPTSQDTAALAARILLQARGGDKESVLQQIQQLQDDDLSYAIPGVSRFRVNICRQRGTLELVLRLVPFDVPQLDRLGLPAVLMEIALEERGLVLVTGVTGAGKSTTLAAMINHINHQRHNKIVTIEDPIEFLIREVNSVITQREIGSDTHSFALALRAALRQDPDVILVGEMRDRETADIALKAAETGHLVFSTVHTPDASKTITRIISMFDQSEHAYVRLRLAEALKATIAQRLLPRVDGQGRVVAMEIMRVTLAIKNCIEEPGKGNIHDLIAKGRDQYGMQTFDQHLRELYDSGAIDLPTAKSASSSPADFERNLQFY